MYKNSFPVLCNCVAGKQNNNKKKCQPEQKVRATIYTHIRTYIGMHVYYSNRPLSLAPCQLLQICHPHPDFRILLHFAITRHANERAHLTLLTHTLPLRGRAEAEAAAARLASLIGISFTVVYVVRFDSTRLDFVSLPNFCSTFPS